MNVLAHPSTLNRRKAIQVGVALAASGAAARFLHPWDPRRRGLAIVDAAGSFPTGRPGKNIHLAATDGWIFLPGNIAPYLPDPAAPAPFTTYMFGFRDVTGYDSLPNGPQLILNQKNKVQHSAPLWWIDEGTDNRVTLTDLGLAQRPDLVDSHTIHFHGFRNAIPLFDGVPELSISVPIGRDFTYFYRPHEPGTYMYHCHFEDVEHVHMGMTGIVFIRPDQNRGFQGGPDGSFTRPVITTPGFPNGVPPGKYCYNDAVDPTADPYYPWPDYYGTSPKPKVTPATAGVSAYDREFALFLSEVWARMHWNDAHIATTDWSEYQADYWLMNGRVYPDTVLPAGGGYDPATGDLVPPKDPVTGTSIPRLQYQPQTSLIRANSGDRVLLRFVNLGYTIAAMTLDGLAMRVVGKDATLLRGRDGSDQTYLTNTVSFGAGESVDAIFTAPSVSKPTRYLLYNRKLAQLRNAGLAGPGGQMTEVWVYPAGTLPPQVVPQA